MCRIAYTSLIAFSAAFIEIATVSVARGTTPEAWDAYELEVASACAAASSLTNPRPLGSPSILTIAWASPQWSLMVAILSRI